MRPGPYGAPPPPLHRPRVAVIQKAEHVSVKCEIKYLDGINRVAFLNLGKLNMLKSTLWRPTL